MAFKQDFLFWGGMSMTYATSYRISLPDETLVGASVRGDTAAFGVLVHRHKDAVYGIAMSRLDGPDRGKDVTQDVFLEAYKTLTALRDPAKFGRWAGHRMGDISCVLEAG